MIVEPTVEQAWDTPRLKDNDKRDAHVAAGGDPYGYDGNQAGRYDS